MDDDIDQSDSQVLASVALLETVIALDGIYQTYKLLPRWSSADRGEVEVS